MLKGIDPHLSGELLKVLCDMGHGNEIVIVDANFTAHSLAAGKPVIQLPGISLLSACKAVLSVFPLDAIAQPVAYMQVSDTPRGYASAAQRAVITLLEKTGAAKPEQCEAVERFAFYERVKHAYAIVQTGELQPYANFLFKKGVIVDALLT
ncbi:RbsD/FucU family protein [Glaciimonas sp. PCH181]|uniref:RbsD/FucU family protein n=1 Tax=Glaciimonas sp. PCH181 TaxID=2133943 RepID=UPI000D33477A|nr:RbsD/FucU domain-containing protein [Glaciimonas sp. PCH181]PUA18981.1 RbsD or FucU transport [Glaciimonas sp. PCH181]